MARFFEAAVGTLVMVAVTTACDGPRRAGPDRDPTTLVEGGVTGHSGTHPDASVMEHDAGARDASMPAVLDASSAVESGTPDGATASTGGDAGRAFPWNLPQGFPVPVVPSDNPMTPEKVELGRYLFHDTRLSDNRTESCATCHRQELAFTDGLATALGSTGTHHPRGSMSLANVAYASTLTWGNPLETDLEHQALVPMFGDDPVELGLTSAAEIQERLAAEPIYRTLFEAAWPGASMAVTLEHVVQALASFERTLISGKSPFDRYLYEGDEGAIGEAAKRGYAVFNSERLECSHCHVGFNLTDHVNFAGKAFFDQPFHNTGLYNIDGKGAYPEPNTGVYHVTKKPADMGRFKAPTLRNIGVTAPYMHDGSVATLEEALDHYQAGGRTIVAGPNAGVGSRSPLRDPVIRPLQMTEQDRADVIAFLESLTDEGFLSNPDFGSPWVSDPDASP